MPTLQLELSNEELHQILVKRSKDRQREEYIAKLHKRQYPLPVELLKIVVWYLPGYCLDWLDSGECIFRLPLTSNSFMKPCLPCIQEEEDEYEEDEEDEYEEDEYAEYEEDEYAEYEEMHNPDYD